MEHLDYFIAIVEARNITQAAQKLHISQPALTRYVNRLETEYGVKLLDRGKNPIALTPAGSVFLEEKLRLETAEMNLRKRLRQIDTPARTLRIGIGYRRGMVWIPPLARELLNRHKRLDLNVIVGGELELSGKLRDSTIDLALGAFVLDDPNFERVVLATESLRLVVPQSFGLTPSGLGWPESFDRPYLLRPEQLNGLNCVEAGGSIGSFLGRRALEGQYSIVHGATLTAENVELMRRLIALGLGYGYVNVEKDDYPADAPVVACTLPGLPDTRTAQAAYLKRHPDAELLTESVTFLRDFLADRSQ